MCGLGDLPIDCGISVQKDLFTPRLGMAYRATDSLVFRAGYSRNPQNDNMIGTRMRNFPVNVQINGRGRRWQHFHAGRQLQPGISAAADSRPQHARHGGAGGRNITTNEIGAVHPRRHHARSTCRCRRCCRTTSRRRSVMSETARTTWPEIRTSTTARSAAATPSLPFNQPGLAGGFRTTAARSTWCSPLGRVQYDSLQVSVNRRMTNGFAMTVVLHVREGH